MAEAEVPARHSAATVENSQGLQATRTTSRMWPTQLSKFALLASEILAPSHSSQSPSTCLSTSTTLEHLVNSFHPFTIPERKYPDYSSYNIAQPNATQQQAWSDTITAVLNVDENCSSFFIPPSINTIYSSCHSLNPLALLFVYSMNLASNRDITWKDRASSSFPTMCGCFMFYPFLRSTFRMAQWRWRCPTAGSFLVQGDRREDLLISGRKRTASILPSDCISSSQGGQHYRYMMDTTHSIACMKFHCYMKSRNQSIDIFHQRTILRCKLVHYRVAEWEWGMPCCVVCFYSNAWESENNMSFGTSVSVLWSG